MNLNRLYQPTPSPQTTEVRQPTEASLSDLRQAQANAEHWRGETLKMDQIARGALDKLESKKLKAQQYKTEAQALKGEVDVWRTRYKEVSASQADSQRAKSELDKRSDRLQKELTATQDRLQKELTATQDRLQKERAELATTKSRLQDLESQLPGIQQRLTQGGTAVRRLQELESQLQAKAKQLEAAEAQVKQLQAKQQTAKDQKQLQASEEQGKLLQAKTKQLQASEEQVKQLQAKVKQLEAPKPALELVAVKEKLRAATHEASAKGAAVLACRDMLARAEQVLQTCSQLHASREEPSELAEALAETTAKIGSFLRAP
jgi:chromosome segregation ATPase